MAHYGDHERGRAQVTEPSAPSVAIVTDGSTDVPVAERRGVPWVVVPDVWRSGPIEVVDTGEHSRDLVRLVLGGAGIEVSAPGFDDFRDAYASLATVDRIYSIHPAAAVTEAVEAARDAAGGFPNVRVVETNAAGIAAGLLAARVRDLAVEGHAPDAIDDYVARHARGMHFFVVPDHFDPVGRQRMFAAVLLSGKPMLSAQDGRMALGRRLRSRRATLAEIERHFSTNAPAGRPIRMAIGHGDAAGAVDPFLDVIERLRPEAVVEMVGRIGPRLIGKVGSRCVGLAWVVE